jgi:hypothetical protein
MDRYRAIADKAGEYIFRNVPPGHYSIEIDSESLPADYGSDQKATALNLTGRNQNVVDFRVIPLRTVSGRVVWDKESGQPGKTSGVPTIVVMLDDFATTTSADGAFTFYNVEPGKHRIRIDVVRLPKKTSPVGQTELLAELTPDRSISNLVFTLAKKDMDTVFQTSP